jgi:hypothetical protein
MDGVVRVTTGTGAALSTTTDDVAHGRSAESGIRNRGSARSVKTVPSADTTCERLQVPDALCSIGLETPAVGCGIGR